MDLSKAISEPFVQLIDFHNAFNRGVKVSLGAMFLLAERAKEDVSANPAIVPTGNEPWGRETRWHDLDGPLKEASIFISEMGIMRAAAAFENYLTNAKGEFDRAELRSVREKEEGAPALKGLDAIFGANGEAIGDLVTMAEFFNVARNCVAHRSNRASAQFEQLRKAPATIAALERWPRRVGKWTLSLPLVVEGQTVEWQPRHAIFASDVFYRCARALDRSLVDRMEAASLTRMAAHWCFFADPAAPCPAKLNPETMVRRQLTNRYRANTTVSEVVELLKQMEMWERVRTAWRKRFPDRPDTSAARQRCAPRKPS